MNANKVGDGEGGGISQMQQPNSATGSERLWCTCVLQQVANTRGHCTILHCISPAKQTRHVYTEPAFVWTQ